jgi:hypothetical protein
MPALATFSGTTINSIHAVWWWVFGTCVVIMLELDFYFLKEVSEGELKGHFYSVLH